MINLLNMNNLYLLLNAVLAITGFVSNFWSCDQIIKIDFIKISCLQKILLFFQFFQTLGKTIK